MAAPELTRIGRYDIAATLGGGAMGVVYKAYDSDIGRPVAIKLIRTDLLDSEERDEYLARFRQEAQAAGRCVHSNIVTIYDYALHDGSPYIAMEFVNGISLSAARQREGRFEPAVAVAIVLQVLQALSCAHALGVVHRDIKPANVLLRGDGQVKVMDFGIARLENTALTQDGAVVGTPSYMAPEQCSNGPIDARSDLFSTGVVLYEMLSGEKPFPGRGFTEVVANLLHHDPAPLHEKLPPGNSALAEVVMRALRKRPEDRFQSAASMIAALQSARPALLAAEASEAFDRTRLLSPAPDQGTGSKSGLGSGQFGPEVLATLRTRLAEHLGPIASLVLRETAPKARDLGELCQSLADRIPTASGRQAFLADVGTQVGAEASLRSSRVLLTRTARSLPGKPAFPATTLEAAQTALTPVLGPIARVLVKRAAERAGTAEELWDLLAQHIDNAAERQAFQAAGVRARGE